MRREKALMSNRLLSPSRKQTGLAGKESQDFFEMHWFGQIGNQRIFFVYFVSNNVVNSFR